jgi:hypothetical protein
MLTKLPDAGHMIDSLTVDHGPTEDIARLALAADNHLRQHKIALSFATVGEIRDINRANSDSWKPLLPLFDPAVSNVGNHNTFCLIGRDIETGAPMVTHAGRLFDWSGTDFVEETRSLRLLYDDPERSRRPGEAAIVTAKRAAVISGNAVFLGAVWWHPSRRGTYLPAIMAKLSRALTYTFWEPDFMFGIMAEAVIRGGLNKKSGVPNVDWSVDLRNSIVGDVRTAAIWLDQSDFKSELADALARFAPAVGDVLQPGRTQHG